MQELKIKLFNFRKELDLEENEIYELVSAHLQIADVHSNLTIVRSINETLKTYTYNEKVRELLENLSQMIETDPVYYNLEDICKVLETRDSILHKPIIDDIRKIMDIKESVERKSAILAILPEYNWITEVQNFLNYYSQKPLITSKNVSDPGSRIEEIFGYVEKVEGGSIFFTEGQWFFIKENSIELGDPINHFEDPNKLNQIFRLQEAARIGTVEEGRITFNILENFNLTLDKHAGMLLNGEVADTETTLESVYQSGLIPIVNAGLLSIIKEASANMKKFMNIDIARKVYNIGNPLSEAIIFNYNEKMYVFFRNESFGNDLYVQDSAVDLYDEMKGKFGADVYEFLQDKFPVEIQEKKKLEKEEIFLTEQVSEIDENISRLEETQMLGENPDLATAHKALLDKRSEVLQKLQDVKNSISES
jgi:hypothetical protein